MAKRTPTGPVETHVIEPGAPRPSERPVLHGHYDGPRGHQDEHRHLGGDIHHGHPDRQALGRVVGREEYVPGDLLPKARQDFANRGTDDTPTVEVPAVDADEPAAPTTDLALATTGNGHRPQKYTDLVRIAEKVEAQRADVQRTIDLETELDAAADLLAVARAQEANSEVVDPSILHQLEEHHDRYAIRLQDWIGQRGLRKVEEAGS